jgi:predicted DNA-binding transcriptional regulator AlpA
VTRDLLTVQELAAELRIAPSTAYDWRSEGKGPASFRLRGRVVYRREQVDAWLREQEAATTRGGAVA